MQLKNSKNKKVAGATAKLPGKAVAKKRTKALFMNPQKALPPKTKTEVWTQGEGEADCVRRKFVKGYVTKVRRGRHAGWASGDSRCAVNVAKPLLLVMLNFHPRLKH
jgi:hypothetical protein